jgi:rod shape-determining protein MreD
VSYSILRGDVEGAIFGFFVGLMQDVFFGNVIGIHALLGALVGFFSAKPFKDYYNENYLLPLISVGLSFVLYELAYYMMVFFFQGRVEIFFYIRTIILPGAIYTLILTLPIYKIIFLINAKLEERQRY